MSAMTILRHFWPAIGEPPGGLPSDLDSALVTACAHYRIPGMAAAVVGPDAIRVASAGVIKLGTAEASSTEHYWHIGSNSKAITATLAALLVQRGLLRWDSTPAEIWPEKASTMHADLSAVTLRELLQHRSGLAPFTSGLEFIGLPSFNGSLQQQARDFSMHLLSKPPKRKRGEFEYSNAGYAIAGAMLGEVGGADYLSLLHNELLNPLGVEIRQGWPAHDDPTQPWGHVERWIWLRPHNPRDSYQLESYMVPAGDLSISMPHYARFLQLHLRAMMKLDSTTSTESELLPELDGAVLRDLHEPTDTYACGWGISESEAGRQSRHDGSAGTFYCRTVIAPDQHCAVTVVANAGTNNAASAVDALVRALLATSTEAHTSPVQSSP
jgi:CubicO group peptidase (beta-lactamase class C family)